MTIRPPELCRRKRCAPGWFNNAGFVCVVRVQTKAGPAGEPYKPPNGRKTLTGNHWPSRLWGLGGRPITCPRKIQKITETVTYKEMDSSRIITARFYSCFKNTTVIQVYAPTNESTDDEKGDF